MEQQRRHLIITDSWFGSVKLAKTLKIMQRVENDGSHKYFIDKDAQRENPNGHELIAAIKMNAAWYPKDKIESIMKKWPSGSHLVLECAAPKTNVKLIAIGHKCNSHKVLCFVMTKNAGSTAPSIRPCVAKFVDPFGDVKQRNVPRPEVLSTHFAHSNAVDAHNQARQHILGLERHWKTMNPWFRNNISIIGMTVTDAWRALRYHVPRFQSMPINDFADCLACKCVHNHYTTDTKSTLAHIEPNAATGETARNTYGAFAQEQIMVQLGEVRQRIDEISISPHSLSQTSVLSPLSVESSFTGMHMGQHKLEPIQKRNNIDGRPVKRRCVICGMDTQWMCAHWSCKETQQDPKHPNIKGVPICAQTCGARMNDRVLARFPQQAENAMTCLALHCMDCKKKMLKGYENMC